MVSSPIRFFFVTEVRGQKHPGEADKYRNSSPYMNHFMLSKYCQHPVQGNQCRERAGHHRHHRQEKTSPIPQISVSAPWEPMNSHPSWSGQRQSKINLYNNIYTVKELRVLLTSDYVILSSLHRMFSTAIDRSSIMTTVHRISIIVYSCL